jgi:hypothetical protein
MQRCTRLSRCAAFTECSTRASNRGRSKSKAAGAGVPCSSATGPTNSESDDSGRRIFSRGRESRLLPDVQNAEWRISVPLWIECKSLEGHSNRKTMADQFAFEQWVKKNGDFYIRVQEDVRPLIAWFDEHGVEKNCDDVALATVVSPLDASLLYSLPCKWCGFPRDKHPKPAFGCPLHLAACNTKLIGKVWSPDLRKGANLNGKTTSTGSPGAGTERN